MADGVDAVTDTPGSVRCFLKGKSGKTMTEAKHAPPTQAAIKRAMALIDVNIAFGDIDDDVAQITTGGMIGDVAELFDAHDDLVKALSTAIKWLEPLLQTTSETMRPALVRELAEMRAALARADAEATKAT